MAIELSFFRALLEYAAYRRAHRFVLAVNTTHPAARSSHPFLEFTHSPSHMVFSRLLSLYQSNPTDPFISCQWRKAFPQSECPLVRDKGFL